MRQRVSVQLAMMIMAAGVAQGGLTTINAPASGELSQEGIINLSYGGGFTASGNDFVNGSLSFVRIDDSSTTALDVHTFTSGEGDQNWQDGSIAVRAQARYAGNSQAFGYNDGTNHTVFTTPGGQGGLGGSPSASFLVGGSGAFTLYDRSPSDGSVYWSSLESNNPVSTLYDTARAMYRQDHMVTYEMIGFGGPSRRFLVFFEDSLNGDYDFNDLAVELQVVPLPPAAWAGLSTLAGVAGLGFIRRRKLQSA